MVDKGEVVAVLLFNELIDSDEKPKRGKTRDWNRKSKENGYFNNIIKELKVQDRLGSGICSRLTEQHSLNF